MSKKQFEYFQRDIRNTLKEYIGDRTVVEYDEYTDIQNIKSEMNSEFLEVYDYFLTSKELSAIENTIFHLSKVINQSDHKDNQSLEEEDYKEIIKDLCRIYSRIKFSDMLTRSIWLKDY